MRDESFAYDPRDAQEITREHNQRVLERESDMERDRRLSGCPTIAESQHRIARMLNALTELALKGELNGRRNEAA